MFLSLIYKGVLLMSFSTIKEVEQQIKILADWNEKHKDSDNFIEQVRLNNETIAKLVNSIGAY